MADDWKVHEGEDGKTLRLTIHDGLLAMSRRDDGKLKATFTLSPIPLEAARSEDAEKLDQHSIVMHIPLHHVELVDDAKIEAVRLLNEALDANGYSFHRKKPAAEGPEAI